MIPSIKIYSHKLVCGGQLSFLVPHILIFEGHGEYSSFFFLVIGGNTVLFPLSSKLDDRRCIIRGARIKYFYTRKRKLRNPLTTTPCICIEIIELGILLLLALRIFKVRVATTYVCLSN